MMRAFYKIDWCLEPEAGSHSDFRMTPSRSERLIGQSQTTETDIHITPQRQRRSNLERTTYSSGKAPGKKSVKFSFGSE